MNAYLTPSKGKLRKCIQNVLSFVSIVVSYMMFKEIYFFYFIITKPKKIRKNKKKLYLKSQSNYSHSAPIVFLQSLTPRCVKQRECDSASGSHVGYIPQSLFWQRLREDLQAAGELLITQLELISIEAAWGQ